MMKKNKCGVEVMGDVEIKKNSLEIVRDKVKRNFLNPLILDGMESHVHEEESR